MTTKNYDAPKSGYKITRDFLTRLCVTSVNPSDDSETAVFFIDRMEKPGRGLAPIFTRDVITPTQVTQIPA